MGLNDLEKHFVRRLQLNKSCNTRDVGFYVASGGCVIKPNVLVRSEAIAYTEGPDIKKLADYGIKTFIDLRCEYNQEHDLSELVRYGIAYKKIPMLADDSNWDYVKWLDIYAANIKKIIEGISESLPAGVLYHCWGGKDRTGVITAFVLLLCGVAEEDVIADYALTAVYIHKGAPFEWTSSETANPWFMYNFLHHLKKLHKNAKKYLLSIGVKKTCINKIRKCLMQKYD